MTLHRRTFVNPAVAVDARAPHVMEKVMGANFARPFQEVWT
ncbi:MAG TPA: hypothetical protein VLA36_11730 [Longimicrobiales bacterium]|nr:hypothetical protein [Longimicrobiales bacterium]